jgi:gliding motility-associated-like protein
MKRKILVLFTILFISNIEISAQLNTTAVGDAVDQGDNCFLITNDLSNQRGGVWYDNPIDFSNDFAINYQNNFGDNDSSGADGMALVFKTTPDAVIGDSGGHVGYGGINNSLIVEFDTWKNGNQGDPSYDHLAIMKNGNPSHDSADNLAGPIVASSSNANIEDGNFHEIKIEWDAAAKVFSVFFDCQLRLTITEDIKNTIFFGDSSVYFGFVGSTGGATNLQQVCFNSISFVDNLVIPENETICLGQEINIDTTIPSGISYSWSPTTGVSDANIANPDFSPTETTDYTATITDNCGELTNYTVTITVSSISTPTFTQIDPICSGETLSDLPTTSTNGISGTWSPAINNTATTTYTFTPGAGECSTDLVQMTVVVNSSTTPTFISVPPICAGETLSNLPTTSTNGIEGIWSPGMNNTSTTTYTFTPDAGECSTDPAQMTVIVNAIITPTFTQVGAICNGEALSDLPTLSNNNVLGTWLPAINNTSTTTYTFTPDASETCAVSQSMTITVNPVITPIFTQVDAIFIGEVLSNLPTTSNNGITGTWSPVINNTATTTYTFTSDASQTCAINQTMTITVNPIPFTVTVNSEIICSSGIATMVATPSPAGFYSYTWIVPVGVDNPGNVQSFSTSVEGDYSVSISKDNYLCNTDFEDNQIVGPGNFTIVNQDSVPCWETTASDSQIEVWGDGFGGFDAYSGNQFIELNANVQSTLFQNFEIIPGSSAVISFAHRGRNSSADDIMEVEIGPIGGPYTNLGSFSDGTDAWGYYSLEYVFPNDLGINYTIRFKSVFPVSSVGNFLDDIGVVFLSNVSSEIATGNVSIINDVIPIFTQVDPICNGDVLALPTTSNNGVTGTWSPAMDNTATTIYTFVPDATQPGQACAVNQTMTITVNPLITPTFTQVDPICNGEALVVLPTTSNNGVTGTWSPAMDNTATTIYTFAPDITQPGQACAVDETMEITVNPIITPTFTQVDPICNGDVLALPTTSNNGVTGTWSPAMNNIATTTYAFTPDAGECSTDLAEMTVIVNPIITPIFTQIPAICSGDALSELLTISNNGINGTWSPSLDNTTTTTYTFTPDAGQCAITSSIDIVVNPIITPFFNAVNPIRSGDTLSNLPSTSNNGISGTWSPAINNTATTNYTFTPDAGQCAVTSNIEIVVSNINNAFSPNGDGVNDIFIIPILFNYLDFEIEVFNRWGTKVYYYNNNGSTSPSWWDGYATVGLLQSNSKPLTVGTYYYIIHLNNKVKEKITGWIYLNR